MIIFYKDIKKFLSAAKKHGIKEEVEKLLAIDMNFLLSTPLSDCLSIVHLPWSQVWSRTAFTFLMSGSIALLVMSNLAPAARKRSGSGREPPSDKALR